jgi:hypothetical protein
VEALPQYAATLTARLLADRGQVNDALRLLEANLSEESWGWSWTRSVSFGIAAELYGLAGRQDIGVEMLRSLEPRHYTDLYGPELHRLHAKLLSMVSDVEHREVERHLEVALQLAREKELKALELRVCVDLAAHVAKRSRREARALLSLVDRFDATADSADLRKARALRDWLS